MEDNKKKGKKLDDQELNNVSGGCRSFDRRYTGKSWKCRACGHCCSCDNPWSVSDIRKCKDPRKRNCN